MNGARDCSSCAKRYDGDDGLDRCRVDAQKCTPYKARICVVFEPEPAPGSGEERALWGLCPNQGRGD